MPWCGGRIGHTILPNLEILHDYGVLGGGRCYSVGGVEVRELPPMRLIMYSTLSSYLMLTMRPSKLLLSSEAILVSRRQHVSARKTML